MKRFVIAAAILLIICSPFIFINRNKEHKLVFAYFSGYRCPWCLKFEESYLNNFEKTYKEKYKGRVELQVYMVDMPMDIKPGTPQYEPAKCLAERNMFLLQATGQLNKTKWIGSMPYGVIGETSLDGDALFAAGAIDRAINKALKNNEVTKLAVLTAPSGNMRDYINIFQAIRAGDNKAVEAFLNKGVDVNKLEEGEGGGNTPLMIASYSGNENMMNMLLAHGADINALNKWDGTALDETVFMGGPEIVELLLSKGAKIGDMTIIAAGMDESIIKILIKHGADINAVIHKDGNTPLTRTLVKKQKDFGPEITIKYVQALINQGADVNKKVTFKDEKGKLVTKTPLQLAQSAEMKKFLISRGAK